MPSERAPKLPWRCECGEWFSNAGPLDLNIQQERDFYWWFVESRDESRNGSDVPPVMSLLAAQLAAEDAALSWLREGVEALGAHVISAAEMDKCIDALSRKTLTSEQVALCVEALRWTAGELPRRRSNDALDMEALAIALGGGT